jgi:hypothetical protein
VLGQHGRVVSVSRVWCAVPALLRAVLTETSLTEGAKAIGAKQEKYCVANERWRLFWRSSQDTFQYLASHVRGDLGRATRLGLVHLSDKCAFTIKCESLRGFRAKLVTAL